MDRKIFVEVELSKLLAIAKPNLTHCSYDKACDGEHVIVHTESGYTYRICIECDSLAAIVIDVFNRMVHK